VTATTSRSSAPFSLSLAATAVQEEEDNTTNRDANLHIIKDGGGRSFVLNSGV
jgi:hypothetical protein